MEAFQQLQVFPVKCTCLTSIKEVGENNGLIYFDFGKLSDVMLIQYLSMQTSKDLVGFTNSGTDPFVKQAISGDNASKVLELFYCLQCCTLNRN